MSVLQSCNKADVFISFDPLPGRGLLHHISENKITKMAYACPLSIHSINSRLVSFVVQFDFGAPIFAPRYFHSSTV